MAREEKLVVVLLDATRCDEVGKFLYSVVRNALRSVSHK
jgi:hypothetical protein